MGAWGPALFSDDLACDVRDEYRELIEDGATDEDAQRRIMESYADVLNDPDESPTFWLALAVTQSKIDRLDVMARERALQVIERGEGLSRWADEGTNVLARRQAVLQKIQLQLTGPQPERKRLRPPWRHITDLTPGAVLAYRTSSGSVILLRVVRIDDDRWGRSPIVSMLRFGPDPLRIPVGGVFNHTTCRVWVHRRKDPDYRDVGFRTLEEGMNPRPGDDRLAPQTETHWLALAEEMERCADDR